MGANVAVFAGDACTDGTECNLFAASSGTWFAIPLDAVWLMLPPTTLESMLYVLSVVVFAPLHPTAECVNETDATAALATLLGRAKAPALVLVSDWLRTRPEFTEVASRLWGRHSSGIANGILDAGSRGHWDRLMQYANAFNIRLRRLHLSQELMAAAITTEWAPVSASAPPPPLRVQPYMFSNYSCYKRAKSTS